tara:strand:- start:1584 stop:1859 length:276 start_codon:yes stop_codon:yes gene_type:complete
MDKFDPVHDSFLKAMHLIKSYIEVHSERLNVKDAEFLTFIAKEVIVNLYAEACFSSDETMITDTEFTKRSNDLYQKVHKDMMKNDIENNLN